MYYPRTNTETLTLEKKIKKPPVTTLYPDEENQPMQ
jgi:hypothetical protein